MAFYFRSFPRFRYANTAAINLTTKLNIASVAKKSTATYFPYTIKEGERADHLANHYYNDPTLSWLVYLANDVVDPYFEWPLTANDFTAHMIKKYGSLEVAQETIVFWKVNWEGNESFLTTAAYEALSNGAKKYWKPVFAENEVIRGYERKAVDWISETNQIINMSYENLSGTLELDDCVHQGDAMAQIVHIDSDNNLVSLKNVSGEFNEVDAVTANNGATFDVLEINSIHHSLPVDEEAYWVPVTAFEHEDQLNNARKNISVIDRSYLPQIEKEVSELFG